MRGKAKMWVGWRCSNVVYGNGSAVMGVAVLFMLMRLFWGVS